jgi:hypothetical protein
MNEQQLRTAYDGSIAHSRHLLEVLQRRVEELSAEEPTWGWIETLNNLNLALTHQVRFMAHSRHG